MKTPTVLSRRIGASKRSTQQRRAFLAVGARAHLVAGEAIAGTRELQEDGRDQEHPDEHVHAPSPPTRMIVMPSAISRMVRMAAVALARISLPSVPPRRSRRLSLAAWRGWGGRPSPPATTGSPRRAVSSRQFIDGVVTRGRPGRGKTPGGICFGGGPAL